MLTPELTATLVTFAATFTLAALLYAARRFYVHYAAQSEADIVARLVRAAEQLLTKAAGEDKLEWVIEQVNYLFPNLRIDETLLRVLIEAEVQKMNAEKGEPPAPLVYGDLSSFTAKAVPVKGEGEGA